MQSEMTGAEIRYRVIDSVRLPLNETTDSVTLSHNETMESLKLMQSRRRSELGAEKKMTECGNIGAEQGDEIRSEHNKRTCNIGQARGRFTKQIAIDLR